MTFGFLFFVFKTSLQIWADEHLELMKLFILLLFQARLQLDSAVQQDCWTPRLNFHWHRQLLQYFLH